MLLTSRKESAFVGQSAFCGVLLFEVVAKKVSLSAVVKNVHPLSVVVTKCPTYRGGDEMVTKDLRIVTKTVTKG